MALLGKILNENPSAQKYVHDCMNIVLMYQQKKIESSQMLYKMVILLESYKLNALGVYVNNSATELQNSNEI